MGLQSDDRPAPTDPAEYLDGTVRAALVDACAAFHGVQTERHAARDAYEHDGVARVVFLVFVGIVLLVAIYAHMAR